MNTVFAFLQYLLPKHLLTRLMWRLTRVTHVPIKNFLIRRFVALFDVDLSDVGSSVPDDFASFNDFFTRALNDDARPISESPAAVVSPVDGTISVAADIESGTLIQAKGLTYTVEDLLATDTADAAHYVDGVFSTIYLAPYNYHRVHAPLDGELTAMRYIPGDLFSVNAATVSHVRDLFPRNERLVMHFQTDHGKVALVFVGALMVGSISTPWSGEIRPQAKGIVQELSLAGHSTAVKKGDLLGWFNMGSTVIVLLPKGSCEWHAEIAGPIRMGVDIGTRIAN